MSKYLEFPVAYLETTDFDEQGNIINPSIPTNLPVVVMAQATWCPHCTTAKPAFQEFVNKHQGKVFVGTMQADGDRPGEKGLSDLVSKINPKFRGFPEYLLFVNGKFVPKEIKGRGVADLEAFVA